MLKFFATSVSIFFFISIQAQVVVPADGCSPTVTFDGNNPWAFGGTNASWSHATPNKTEITDDISVGGQCVVLGGNTPNSHYNNNEDSWAQTQEYDLSAVNNPYLDFYFYHSNENSTSFDEIWMEYSTDGGTTWSTLSPAVGGNNCYDQNWYNFVDNWGGASPAAANSSSSGSCSFGGGIGPTDWLHVRKCIQNFANESSIIFRYRIEAGFTCNFWGATIDEFKICDANIDADADFTCTNNSLTVNFNDLTGGCTDGWSWNFGDGNTSNMQNPTHTYVTAGTYTVTLDATASLSVTSGCGGPYNDSYSFDIEVLEAVVNQQNNPTCAGVNDGSIDVSVSGNTSGVSYNWSPAGVSGQGTSEITNLAPGNYTLTVSPVNDGCPLDTTIELESNSPVDFTAVVTNESCTGECDGSIIINNITGGTSPYTYSWANTNNTTDTEDSLCSGNQTITVEGAQGCTVSNTINVGTNGTGGVAADFSLVDTIYFYENPVSANPVNSGGVWLSSCANCIDSDGNFDPGVAGIGTYQICYKQGGGGCQKTYCEIIEVIGCQDTVTYDTTTIDLGASASIHGNQETEEATYIGEFTSQYGCDSTSNVFLNVIVPFEPVIPNVFTPNGDNKNDEFYISGQGFTSYKCQIFNRWGNPLATFEDGKKWDGTNQNNKRLPNGVYFGLATFKAEDGSTQKKNFSFHLVNK